MVCKLEKVAFETYWNVKIVQIYWIIWYLKKNISIHKLCPQSVLKHSVVHFQGIGMKFRRFFFKIFLSKYVEKWDFKKVWIRAWQGLDKGWIKVLEWDLFYFVVLIFPFFSFVFIFFVFFFCCFFLLLIFCLFLCFFCFFLFLLFFLFCLFFVFCCFFSTLGLDCFFLFFKLRFGFGFVFLVHFIFLSFYRSCL